MNVSIDQLLAEEMLEHVIVEESLPQLEFEVANRHFKTAKLAEPNDPEAAFQLLYDSARKALQAVLFTRGLRVRRPPRGNHYTYVLVTRTDLVNQEVWRSFDWMRELRNDTEYWTPGRSSAQGSDVIQAMQHVSRMLEDASCILGIRLSDDD